MAIPRLLIAVIIAVAIIGGIVAFYSLQPNVPQQATQPPKPVQLAETQISDAKGDAGSAPLILDIVSARVAKSGDKQLSFEVVVSGEIPKEPEGFIEYVWFLTSGTTLNRPGIVLVYDNKVKQWDAIIVNNTGAQQQPKIIVKGLDHTISGDTAKVSVPLDLLGNPSTFTWHVVSRNAPLDGRVPRIDKAPDAVDVEWPAK